jgi:superfamily II RNA helicase
MKAKLVYIMEEEDVEVLRMAKNIINLLHNTETEYKNENVKKDLLKEFSDIEDMCVEGISLDELYKEKYDDYEEDEGDEEDEPIVDFCEYCGCVIEEDDTHWVAANCAVCCCEECVAAYNRENFPEDDEEDDEDL